MTKAPFPLPVRVMLSDIAIGDQYVVDRRFTSSTFIVSVLDIIMRRPAVEWDIKVRFEESYGRNPHILTRGDILQLHVRDECNEEIDSYTDAVYYLPITLATEPPTEDKLSEKTESAWYHLEQQRIAAKHAADLTALERTRKHRLCRLEEAKGCRKIRAFLKHKISSCGGPRHWSGRLPGTFNATFQDWRPTTMLPGTEESYPNRLGNDPGGHVYREAAENYRRRNTPITR